MKRNVYALLTAAIVASGLNMAQAETMAERKQRIMRKYMRERQDIMQSDLGVPDAPQEDARVLASEQFKELSPEFERQTGGVMPLPNVRPMPMQQPEGSWWLETAEMEEDPFANPFLSKTDGVEESADSRSPWGRRDDSSAYGGASSQLWDGRGDTFPGSQSLYGMQNKSGNGSSVSGMTYDDYTIRRSPASRGSDQMSGFYGRQQTDTRGTDGRWGLDSAGRYGPLPSAGILQSPSPFDTQNSSSQNQSPGYTPYRNPYEVQSEEQRRYGGNLQPQQPQYSRPNNYEKWKDSNNAWDPTSGNSYLDELMRDERR